MKITASTITVGYRRNRLTAVQFVRTERQKGQSRTYWLWRCDCGTEKEILADNVLRGFTRSCGCLQHDVLLARNVAASFTTDELIAELKRRGIRVRIPAAVREVARTKAA